MRVRQFLRQVAHGAAPAAAAGRYLFDDGLMKPFQFLSRGDRAIHEERRHFLARLLEVAFEDLDGELFLRLEMVVEVGGRHPGGFEDLVDARRLVPVAAQDGRSCLYELLSVSHTLLLVTL